MVFINIEVLISTMNQTDNDYSLLDRMNIKSNAIVVNQCGKNSVTTFDYNGNRVKWINSDELGLSRSRNLALSYATSDICILADDDMIFETDYVNTINNMYMSNPEADIISYIIMRDNRITKKISNKKKVINILYSMKLSSVEISFKRESIVDANLMFDTRFGAGEKYNHGEENIFLSKCIKTGKSIIYIPEVIGNVITGDSSWFTGFNQQYFLTKGAMYKVISKRFYSVLILLFAFRKTKLYKQNLSIIKAIKYMFLGAKEITSKI